MASITVPANNPVTQIFYFTVEKDQDLSKSSDSSKIWSKAIDIVEQHPGFQRCYWGRSPENPEKVQLHIVRDTLANHKFFLSSEIYTTFLDILHPLTATTSPLIRHAHLHAFTVPSPLQHPFPPFAGSAIYVKTTPTWHQGSWPLWTHIVRYVKGCTGIAGGNVVEEVDGCSDCYLVYVGWESIELHEEYHHTKHFASRRIVLGLGNEGYREYGHVCFEGHREGRSSAKL